MSTTAIIEAAFQRLEAFVYVPQPDIIWPGQQSIPPETGMWLEANMFPNENEDIAWNDNACVDVRGFLQVAVHYRPGQGQEEPVLLADAIAKHYPKGLALGPVRVLQRPWQSMPVIDEDDLFIPVTIPYQGLV